MAFYCGISLAKKEGNVLFNDALNTEYIRLISVGYLVKDHSDNARGNSLLFTVNKDILYAPSYRHDNTYHGFCQTSCGALAGTRNSSMSSSGVIAPTTHGTTSGRSTTEPRSAPAAGEQ